MYRRFVEVSMRYICKYMREAGLGREKLTHNDDSVMNIRVYFSAYSGKGFCDSAIQRWNRLPCKVAELLKSRLGNALG